MMSLLDRDSYLVHDTLFAVVVGILHGVEPVDEGRLLRGGIAGGSGFPSELVAMTNTCSTSSDTGGTDTSTSTSKTASSRVVLASIKRVEVTVHSTLADLTVLNGVTLAVLTVHHVLESAADVLGLALEAVVALLTSTENTALLLEVGQGHGGKLGGLVHLSSVVVNLVDGNSGVDNIGLDGFLVDYRLDGLVDVLC